MSASAAFSPVVGEIADAEVVLLDGTFWSETELIDAGLGTATARDMAHLPLGGAQGMLEQARDLRVPHRLLTHVNNTNPLLDPRSNESTLTSNLGWRLAHDGMRIVL